LAPYFWPKNAGIVVFGAKTGFTRLLTAIKNCDSVVDICNLTAILLFMK